MREPLPPARQKQSVGQDRPQFAETGFKKIRMELTCVQVLPRLLLRTQNNISIYNGNAILNMKRIMVCDKTVFGKREHREARDS